MQSRIILISDDSDFFEYITPKLVLRKYDELFKFTFTDIIEKSELVSGSVFIINSEGAEEQTLNLLSIFKENPCIVFSYNENEAFKINAYQNGAFSFITPFMSDKEIQAQMIPVLNASSVIRKNTQYRNMLVKEELISAYSEVFSDYTVILDDELKILKENSGQAVLGAIL